MNIGGGAVIEIGDISGGLFKINMVIKNTATVEAIDVDWSISLDGGFILLGKESFGTVTGIPAGGEVTVTSDMIVGFGKPTVICNAEIPGVTMDSKEVDATVLLFFINI
jgi:hypothetical protein